MAQYIYTAGTISISGSTVTGTLTAFSQLVRQGDLLIVGQNFGVVAADPTTETSITLTAAWSGAPVTNAAYTILLFSPRHEWPLDVWDDVREALSQSTVILNGTAAPSASLGVMGAVYFDTANQVFYGPKNSGGWPAGVSMKGVGLVPTSGDALKLVRANANGSGLEFFSLRELLTSDRIYYVSTTGNDSNSGMSAGAPFATFAKAMAVINALDFGIFNVTLQLAAGTYAEQLTIDKPRVGAGVFTVRGDPASNGSYILNGGQAVVLSHRLASVVLSGVEIRGADGIVSNAGGVCTLSGVAFGACTSRQMFFGSQSYGLANASSYSIRGGAAIHCAVASNSVYLSRGATVNIEVPVTFSDAMYVAQRGAEVLAAGANFVNPANVTGKKFRIDTGGRILTEGAGVSFIPGTIAGTADVATYGLYT